MAPNSRRRIYLVLALTMLLVGTLAWPLQAAFLDLSPIPTPPAPPPFNTPGPRPTHVVPPAPPTARPAPGTSCSGFWYTVRYGDTLNRLAARYGTTVWKIMTCNHLANANRIYVGQRLLISGSAPGPHPGPGPGPSCRTVYYVKWGDTLAAIARRYGTTVGAIANLNNLWSINHIWAGQRLVIPC